MEAAEPLLEEQLPQRNIDKTVNPRILLQEFKNYEGDLLRCWSGIAIEFGASSCLIEKTKIEVASHPENILLAIYNLLGDWVMRETSDVPISKLIQILENVKCNNLAEHLRRKYAIPRPVYVASSDLLKTKSPIAHPAQDEPSNETTSSTSPIKVDPATLHVQSAHQRPKMTEYYRKTSSYMGGNCGKKVKIAFMVVIFLILAGLIFLGIYTYNILRTKENTKIDLLNTTDNVTQCPISIHDKFEFRNSNSTLGMSSIIASYEMFLSLSTVSFGSELFITLLNPEAWIFQSVITTKSCSITSLHLAGNYSIHNIINIAAHFPNLRSWYFERDSQFLIEHLSNPPEHPEKLTCPIHLTNIKSLTLNFSSFYTPLYLHLDNCLSFENLEVLKVVQGSVSDENIVHIISMISKSPKLQIIEISSHLQLTSELFSLLHTKMSDVSKVVINNLNEESNGINSFLIDLGNAFCDIFHNLKVFQSQHGSLLFRNRHQLFSCVLLRNLEVSFYVDYEASIHLGLFHKLPDLHSAKIFLRFRQCPSPIHRKQMEKEKLRKNNSLLKICSRDCPLNYDGNKSCLYQSKNYGK